MVGATRPKLLVVEAKQEATLPELSSQTQLFAQLITLDYEDYMALYLYPSIDLWLIWGIEVNENHDPVFLLMELHGISSYTFLMKGTAETFISAKSLWFKI